jgi:transcription termination factor 2
MYFVAFFISRQLNSCPTKEEEVEDPVGLTVPLMTHQRQALAWLSWREAQSPPGGILADDMGLGKTLTMISFVLLQRSKEDAKQKEKVKESGLIHSSATLVVAPASLIYQWNNEIKRRCQPGTFSVLMHHGPQREMNPHK